MARSVIEYALTMVDLASPTVRKVAKETDSLTQSEKEERAAAEKATAAKESQKLALMGYAAAAIAAVTAGAALVKSVVDARNALLDASARTGVAADTVQALGLAFEGSGQSAQAAEGFLKGYTARLSAVSRGSKEADQAFADLGVSTRDLQGNLRSSDAILNDTIRALSAIEDPTKRATAATLALGEQGTMLLQALGNADSLESFSALTGTFGSQVGPRAATAAAEWQRATAALDVVLAGAADRVVEMSGGVEAMTGAIRGTATGVIFAVELLGWFAENVKAAIFPIRALAQAWSTLGAALVLVAEGDFSAAGRALETGVGDALDTVTSSIETMVLAPTRLADAMGVASDRADDFAAALDGINAATGGGGGGGPFNPITKDAEVATKAVEDTTEKVDELAAALDALASEGPGLLAGIQSGLQGILTDFERRIMQTGSQFASLMQGASAPLVQRGIRAGGEAIGGAVGGAGGAAVGALAGAGVAAVVPGLAALGQAEGGGDAVAEQAVGYLDDIAAGIGQLDELIVGIAKRLPGALLDVAVAILKGLPNILFALLVELPVAFMRGLFMWFRDVWEGIKAFFRGALNPLTKASGERTALGKVADALKEVFTLGQADTQTFNGSRDVGGLIPETGLYMLHAGETVVRGRNQGPNSGSTRAAGMMAGMGSGANVVINVNAPVADSNFAEYMGRELERLFGTGGLRSSTVLG